MTQETLHDIVLAIAIISVAAIEATAIIHGTDGVNFSIAVGAISGIAGFKLGILNNP